MNFILDVYIFIFFEKFCYSEKSTHLHGCRQLVHSDGMKTSSVDIVVFILCRCL